MGNGFFISDSIALTYLAARVRRQAPAREARYDGFLPHVALILGFLFTFALVLEGLAAFLLPMCR